MAYYLGRRQYCTHHNVFSLSLSLSCTVTVSLLKPLSKGPSREFKKMMVVAKHKPSLRWVSHNLNALKSVSPRFLLNLASIDAITDIFTFDSNVASFT